MSMMAAVASRPRRPANSSKSGALGNLRFARAALENRLLTRFFEAKIGIDDTANTKCEVSELMQEIRYSTCVSRHCSERCPAGRLTTSLIKMSSMHRQSGLDDEARVKNPFWTIENLRFMDPWQYLEEQYYAIEVF
ncbi:hypothetical protein EVAR_48360_1 [Eumeta japonica]|uniref:Uncharacterized protein n=1 Tax=Eumeta variegata TaxID=151549 RepID=A0A4C1WMC2_EUMVA|nr:hypothetical protein EVAR_48360_1 [Eumeta japonica]